MEDAQGVPSSGDRQGVILLDLQGLPMAPAAVQWVAYNDEGVMFDVTPAGESYPPVKEVTWSGAGQTGTCVLATKCLIGPLKPGEKHEFSFRSVNAVGESREAKTAEAWAYKPPAKPRGATWKPVPNGNEGGIAEIVVQAAPDTKEISLGGTLVATVVNGEATFKNVPVSNSETTTFHAVPISAHEVPPIPGGSAEGDSYVITGVHGVGAPSIRTFEVTGDGKMADVYYSVDTQSGSGTSVRVEIKKGAESIYTGTQSSGSKTVDMKYGEKAVFTITAWNVYDGKDFGSANAEASHEVSVPMPENVSAAFVLEKNSEEISGSGEPEIFVWRKAKLTVSASCKGGEPKYVFGSTATADGEAVVDGDTVTLPSEGSPQVKVVCVADGKESDPVTQGVDGSPGRFYFEFKKLSGKECPDGGRPSLDTVRQDSVPSSLLTVSDWSEGDIVGWVFKLKDSYKFSGVEEIKWVCEVPPPPPTPEKPDEGDTDEGGD